MLNNVRNAKNTGKRVNSSPRYDIFPEDQNIKN